MSMHTPTLEARSKLGKFLLMKTLGQGGMGIVWLAEDTTLGRNVALKVIRPEYAYCDDVRTRFLQEARAAARVEHERIVRVFEVGENDKVPYIAMELLKGRDLWQQLREEPIPPLPFAVKVTGQVLQGLAAAHNHASRLIHRDIKPQNVWLEPLENKHKFRCKILDFGIAKSTSEDAQQTGTGAVVGTLDYMSPEQLKAEHLDQRCDLFAVGVMLYRMLTGEMPYHTRTFYQRGVEMHTSKPKPPSDFNGKLPQSISDFTLRLMATDRDNRPAGSREAVAELEAILKGVRHANTSTAFVPIPKVEPIDNLSTTPEHPRVAEPDWVFDETHGFLDHHTTVVPRSGKIGWKLPVAIAASAIALLSVVVGLNPGKASVEAAPASAKTEPKAVSKVAEKPREKPQLLDCTNGADPATVRRVQNEWAAYLGVPVEASVDVVGTKMEFILIPPGKFLMGTATEDAKAILKANIFLNREFMGDEQPRHEATLTKPFYLAKFETTRDEYARMTGGSYPGGFRNETQPRRMPVDGISWNDAKEFCDRIPLRSLPKGFGKATLPTEMQWEYACRAGTRSLYSFGDSLNGTEANCAGDFPFGTTEKGPSMQKLTFVGSYKPNAFNLFDMHGNVMEWCLDGYDPEAYQKANRVDAIVEDSTLNHRVLRGGCWNGFSRDCRSATRVHFPPDSKMIQFGFRVALLPN